MASPKSTADDHDNKAQQLHPKQRSTEHNTEHKPDDYSDAK